MINYLSHWDNNLTQSRGNIAIHLNDSYIRAICPSDNPSEVKKYYKEHIQWELDRKKLVDLVGFVRLSKILKNINNNEVFHVFTLKSGIIFSFVVYFYNIKKSKSILSVNGLGYLFSDNAKAILLRNILRPFLKKTFNKSFDVIIFQNEDDKSQLENYLKFINKSQLIESSGINTEEYVLKKTFNKKLKIILASRLLKDKGIKEYSNLIKKFDKNKFEFYLAGEIDKGNPSSLNENELEEILKDKSLKFLGYLDIKNELHNYDILISMSKYEGFSRIMLEGTYVGLFCASLENSGTKFIKELENTILINAEELENAHNEIIMSLTNSMDISLNNRTKIINKYSTKAVAEKFLAVYKEI
jgi:glycosyltransferase involved in cell wall biosynthesis